MHLRVSGRDAKWINLCLQWVEEASRPFTQGVFFPHGAPALETVKPGWSKRAGVGYLVDLWRVVPSGEAGKVANAKDHFARSRGRAYEFDVLQCTSYVQDPLKCPSREREGIRTAVVVSV